MWGSKPGRHSKIEKPTENAEIPRVLAEKGGIFNYEQQKARHGGISFAYHTVLLQTMPATFIEQ
jgi:hypothetical protein